MMPRTLPNGSMTEAVLRSLDASRNRAESRGRLTRPCRYCTSPRHDGNGLDVARRWPQACSPGGATMAIKNPPKGYGSVTPTLSLTNAAKAIDFYRKAFGAEEEGRFPGPDGRIMHAEIRIGDSRIMLNDVMPEMGAPATTSSLWIYCDDTDGLYNRAVAAGAKVLMPPTDAFWGD